MSLKTIRFRVTGRVQGVGFRYATQREATILGLKGWVRNCENGDVELLASGSRDAIDHLTQWLETGPRYAVVTKVEQTPASKFLGANFEIRT